ncbi:hypothetical protein MCG98_12015 [Ruminococcus sp. OA3]|uniref:hypothetical protein n=1 Tax=Ruminococcus sp. OA3 TaxID=2914164 RepID=UPI001F057BAB|nr:hypothetical protein [Ruminococcus sp. OA3]MCH1983288.1 hypothetical protein [Ruminococcus sp. OA3]
MAQKQSQIPATFEVHIEECNNFTWQGKLISESQTIEFRSELELLRVIDKLLCGDREEIWADCKNQSTR